MTTLAEFELKNCCKIRMILHLEEVKLDKLSQFDLCILFLAQATMEFLDESLDFFLKDTNQEVILTLEV